MTWRESCNTKYDQPNISLCLTFRTQCHHVLVISIESIRRNCNPSEWLRSFRLSPLLNFSELNASTSLSSPSSRFAEIVIQANDDAAGIISFSKAAVVVQEHADQVVVDVVRERGHFGRVSNTLYVSVGKVVRLYVRPSSVCPSSCKSTPIMWLLMSYGNKAILAG